MQQQSYLQVHLTTESGNYFIFQSLNNHSQSKIWRASTVHLWSMHREILPEGSNREKEK